jgi:hypothetical protein
MGSAKEPWCPRFIKRQETALKTGTRTIKVVTDQGAGYLKALGNPEGPHVLVCELVGTRLARWLGLPTFEFGIIPVIAEYGLTFFDGGEAEPGPAFISRYEPGESWGGTARQLEQLVNPEDITRLVVFDTWTRNCDRYAPDGRRINRDNVYLSEDAPPAQFRLTAMDHSHCFTCGRPLTAKLAHIEQVRDDAIYGLFPEFGPWLDGPVLRQVVERLGSFRREDAEAATQDIPGEWDVNAAVREALVGFLASRAAFLGSSIMTKLCPTDLPKIPGDEAEPNP